MKLFTFSLCFVVLALAVLRSAAVATPTVFQVVDPSGKPVAGATVYLLNQVNATTPQIVSADSNGNFTADASDKGVSFADWGVTMCMVAARGFAAAGSLLTTFGDHRIVLSLPVVVTGTVVDQGGKAVSGALVAAQYAMSGAAGPALPQHFSIFIFEPLKDEFTTKTDSSGNYSIPNLPANTAVVIKLVDKRFVNAAVTTAQGDLMAPALTAKPGASISGKLVRRDGKPLGPVTVQAQSISASGAYMGGGSYAQSAADGTYEITGLDPGSYSLVAYPDLSNSSASDWAPPAPVTVTTSVQTPGVAPDLVLTAGTVVSGTIIDAVTKAPVPGVGLNITDANSNRPGRSAQTVTDVHGRYTVHAWAGTLQIRAYKVPADYAVDQMQVLASVNVTDGQPVDVDPIALLHGLTATGKVVDETGKPVAGVQIQPMRVNGMSSYSAAGAMSGADGTYQLNGLMPGSYTISAVQLAVNAGSQDFAEPAPVSIEVVAGKASTVPNIVLTRGVLVTGTIVDGVTKQPVPGVQLGIQDPYVQGKQTRSVNGVTDAHGQFVLRVWPGTLHLYVYNAPTGYVSLSTETQRTIKVVEGQPITIDPIPLEKALDIDGIAVDETGKPVSAVVIQVQRSDNDGNWLNIPAVTTGQDGKFSIAQLAPGHYYIDPGADWTVTSPASFNVPSENPLKLFLKKAVTTSLQGTVVDTSGAPLPGATVVFNIEHGASNGNLMGGQSTATTDQSGYFNITDVPFNSDMVQKPSVTKDGYLYQSGGDITTSGDRLTISLIVLAKLGGSVSGIVRNGLNAPVAGAWVACAAGNVDIRPVQTDATGSFKFGNLVFGPVDLYAAKGSYYGHVTVDTTKAASQNTTLLLSTSPTPASLPGRLSEADTMLTNLLDYVTASGTTQQQWWLRDQCAYVLEVVSPTAGLGFLEARTKVNTGDLNAIVPARPSEDAAATAQWVLPLLATVNDNGYGGGLAASLGLAVAPYDIDAANSLYSYAVKKISLDHLKSDNLSAAMDLASLAYAVKNPDADEVYKAVFGEINKEIAAAQPAKNGYSTTDWLMLSFAESLVRSNVKLAIALLPAMPVNNRLNAAVQMVTEITRSNPDGALDVFHTLSKDDPQGPWAYDNALVQVLPILFKSDPVGAVGLARSVTDPRDRSEAVTEAADLSPLIQARALYSEAETDSVDQSGQGSTPASIAAHAYLRDQKLGAELFKQAYDKVMAPLPSDQQWNGPSYSEFAFYYSRYDPGYSRTLVENQFHKDLVAPGQQWDKMRSLSGDVAAMAAVDPERANEMVEGIKDPDARFAAGLKVAQYAAFGQNVRDTLPFSNWSTDYSWTADNALPW